MYQEYPSLQDKCFNIHVSMGSSKWRVPYNNADLKSFLAHYIGSKRLGFKPPLAENLVWSFVMFVARNCLSCESFCYQYGYLVYSCLLGKHKPIITYGEILGCNDKVFW